MKINPSCLPFALGALALHVSAFAQTPAEPAGASTDEVVRLPVFTVSETMDLPPPEQWHYAQVAGFEVLSNTSVTEANRLLRGFQRFREALQIVRPVPAKPVVSSALILCGGRGRFADFTPDGKRDYNGIVSLLLRDREQTTIVLDLETRTLEQTDLSVRKLEGGRYDGIAIEHDRQLYREYIRYLLTQTDFPPPPWLIEGITQIVMDIEFRERTINYGRLDVTKGAPVQAGGTLLGAADGRTMDAGSMVAALTPGELEDDGGGEGSSLADETYVGDRPFNVVLANQALLPLDQFFAVTADAPAARNPLGDSLWAKQAYAFVHMCLFRADGKFQKPYAAFVERLANEPVTEALFHECFGLTYPDMLRELRRYIRNPHHNYRHIELTNEGRLVATDVEFREATQGEIGRIKGDAQRLAGRRTDAFVSYRVAYARDERDPRLLAALGIEEQHAGQTERARALLEAAAGLGADRPSAYVALARLRLDEARGRPAAGDRLDEAQLIAVLDPLFQARARKPPLPETYEVMAEAWALSSVPPKAANVRVLGEGVMLFPFRSELTYQTARLHAAAGDHENAVAITRMGIRFAGDADTRTRFEALLTTMTVAPPSS